MVIFRSFTVDVVLLSGHPDLYLASYSYGLVYIKHNDQYGTVCDDVFAANNNGCDVVCGQLGYE